MTAQTVEASKTDASVYVVAPGPELARILGNVLPCAGKDNTLPILTAVHVKVTADRIEVAATDRYTLAVDYIDHGKDDPTWPDAEFNVSGKDVANIIKLSKAAKLSPLTLELLPHGKVTASTWDGSVGFQLLDGEFPRYGKLFWEGDGEPLAAVGINPSYCARFAKIMRDDRSRKPAPAVRLAFNGRKPVLVTVPGYESFRGLMMPVRLDS